LSFLPPYSFVENKEVIVFKSYELRPYQQEVIDAITRDWDAGYYHTLACVATGGGKTNIHLSLMLSVLQQNTNARALVIVPNLGLVDQTKDRVLQVDLLWNPQHVGIIQAEQNECDRPLTIATIQSLMRGKRLSELLAHGAITHLVSDEAHHAMAESYRSVIARLMAVNPQLRHIGLTATPMRSDKAALSEVYQQVSANISIADLVHGRYLVQPKWLGISTGISLAGVETATGVGDEKDFNAAQLARLYNTAAGRKIVVDAYLKHAPKRLAVAFCASVAAAKDLAHAFNDAKIPAACIDGTMTKDERKTITDDFIAGKIRVLTNCQVFGEGWDCPSVSCILMCRPTRSDGAYIQRIGRGLRPHDGEQAKAGENCLILDFVPKETRNIVLAGDILGLPKEVTRTDADVPVGEVTGEFTYDGQSFHTFDGVPLEVRARELRYLQTTPHTWTRHEGWLMLHIGVDDNFTHHTLVTSPWEYGKEQELLSITSGRDVPPTVKREAKGGIDSLLRASEQYVRRVGVKPVTDWFARMQQENANWKMWQADTSLLSVLHAFGYHSLTTISNADAIDLITWAFSKVYLAQTGEFCGEDVVVPEVLSIEATGEQVIVDGIRYQWLFGLRLDTSITKVKKWNCWYHRTRYRVTISKRVNGHRGSLNMARLIINVPLDKDVLHLNGDTLDCRLINLKSVVRQGSRFGKQKPKSGFWGVIRDKKRYLVRITVNGERMCLGLYDTPEEAARVYDKAARHHFGDDARLNFPDET
jgi:superfamily II DNA or RNA helicase